MRTLLRSWITRHADGVLVSQFMEAEFQTNSVATLTSEQALRIAAEFKIDLPTRQLGDAYAKLVKAGHKSRAAMAMVEKGMREAGQLANVKEHNAAPVANGGTPIGDDETPDLSDDDETPVSEVAADAARDAAVAADLKDVFGAFGQGDMSGFKDKVRALAERANEPKHVTQTVVADYSAITGKVSARIGAASMTKAGVPCPVLNVNEAATVMALYDGSTSPARDDDYIWPECTAVALSKLARGKNVFLTGPAGTGKTTFAEQVAAYYGRSLVRISCDDQTDAAQLVGMTVPVAGGGSGWQDGQLAYAIRRPGTVVLIDEPSVARAGALMVFQAVLDGARTLFIAETGEAVRCAPDVVFILADNTNGTGDATGQHEGTRIINRATLDRASVTIEFGYMAAAEEAKAIEHRSGCNSKVAKELASFAQLTRTAAHGGELRYAMGMRRLVSLGELFADGCGAAYAFAVAVLNTAPPEDLEKLRQLWTTGFSIANANVEA